MTELESARLLAERFIDYQPRTSSEVRRRLSKAEFEPDVVESVLADLETVGLLNDSQFSADWVESRSRAKNLGRVRLASELRIKGVGRETVDSALESLEPEAELESALSLAVKRFSPDSLSDPHEKRRLAAYLQRRGFKWDIIEQVFAKLSTNTI